MKRILLGTTALLGVVTLVGEARASDGIKLDVGGFFRTVYQGVFDKKSGAHFGNHRNYDRFMHNAEIYFSGETTLDNGLTVGARVELEGETQADQIDKSYIWFSGGFGKVQIGSQDAALAQFCIMPPGATTNFSAFSPNAWGSNDPIGSNPACVDTEGNSQKIVYITPNFSGFQLAVSYTPNNNAESYNDVGVNGAGTPNIFTGTATHSFGAYATYEYAGDGWGINWGGGASTFGKIRKTGNPFIGILRTYQTDLNITVGNFAIGGVLEYFDNHVRDASAWVAGGGASYTMDAWTLGLTGSHGHFNASGSGLPGNGHDELNTVMITGNYALAPGVSLDAAIGYTWFSDTDDVSDPDRDHYSAVNVGIGSAFTF